MIDTYLLEQLTAIEECGTLSAASEKLHLTQPTLTRAMQKLEALMGVTLFDRSKNRAVLNGNGRLAAQCARHILSEQQLMVERVRALDRSRRTIAVGAIAPGAMYELSPLLSSLYTDRTVSVECAGEAKLLAGLQNSMEALCTLSHASNLPSFKTDVSLRTYGSLENRVYIPFTDDAAAMPYYCYGLVRDEKNIRPDSRRWNGMHRRGIPRRPSADNGRETAFYGSLSSDY